MKNKKKAVVYDLDYMQAPLQSTLDRIPTGIKNTRIHRLLFLAWVTAGGILAGMAVLEVFTNLMYNVIIGAATNEMSDFFGLDAQTMAGMASDALVKGKPVLIVLELGLSALFFLCANYSNQLIARGKYIIQLEKAAEAETSLMLKEKQKEYEAEAAE